MARDPASEAILGQRSTGYRVDFWLNVKLEPLMKLWQGIGGHSNFFFSEEDAREARGAYVSAQPFKFAETLWRLSQVQPSLSHGFRHGIREYVVDLGTAAAVGVCRANIQLGSGSVLQYFVPDWNRTLHATGRTYAFEAKKYP
jgi:hypothetical protein